MATDKKFSVVGTSTFNGKTKVRFANDSMRVKILAKNGHEAIELIELEGEFTKAEICQMLINHPKFQDEAAQSAIAEFVVRNCKTEAKKEVVAEAVEAESTEA